MRGGRCEGWEGHSLGGEVPEFSGSTTLMEVGGRHDNSGFGLPSEVSVC